MERESTNNTNLHELISEKEIGMSQKLILKEEVYAVVGAAMEVYNELGCGFLEPVYQEALAMELRDREIPFNEQCVLQIRYKGRVLNKTYCSDFICFEKLIVEIK